MRNSAVHPRPLVTLVAVGFVAVFGGAACGGDDTRPAEWGYIAPVILAPTCATVSCHSEAAAVAGLDLSTPDKGYRSLLEGKVVIKRDFEDPHEDDVEDCADAPATAQECLSTRPLVNPGFPDQSRVVRMLRAEGANRMPPDRPLPEADIALIERWIAEGASDE